MKNTAKRKLIAALIPLMLCIGTPLSAQPRPAPAPRPTAMTPAAMTPTPARPAPRPATMAPVPRATMAPAAVPAPTTAPAPAPKADKPTTAPAPAKKADAKKDSWWKVLIGGLLEILLVFILAIAAVLGKPLIAWVAKKVKVEDAKQIAQMETLYDTLVGIGVNYATQQAHKLRDNPDAKGKRLDWGVEMVQKLIKDYGLPEKTANWIKKRIEAKLGQTERSNTPT